MCINGFNWKFKEGTIWKPRNFAICWVQRIGPRPCIGSKVLFTKVDMDAQTGLREKKAQGQSGNKHEREKNRRRFFREKTLPEEKGEGQDQSRRDKFQRRVPGETI